jgi:26S proteasome regulatory subunit N12
MLRVLWRVYSSILPHSEREYPIRGLNLIRLLIQNRIADFHTTLESLPLPADELLSNPFIRHPVNLERWLMEGSYSKVWNAREEAPAEEYKFFVDSLMGTIRFVTSFLCPRHIYCVGNLLLRVNFSMR